MMGEPETFEAPVTVRVGVTGQRSLQDEYRVRASIRKVLSRIDQILSHTPHSYVALTSLSEGSDRILASEVLAWETSGMVQGTGLEILLPVPRDEYLEECATHESREACVSFLESASRVEVVSSAGERRDLVCEEIGQTIVQNSDVLIAIWNGLPSSRLGGTAEMVRYARRFGRTLFWIHADSGKVTEERHGDGILECYEYLDGYNSEEILEMELAQRIKERYSRLLEKARFSGLDPDFLEPLAGSLLPYYVRCMMLSGRYQRRYMWAGTAVYALAAVAVATVTIQTLFFPEYPSLLWIEVVEMGVILFLIMASRFRDWHRKWVDYRFLSERLRTAMFLSLFCIRVEKPISPRHLKVFYESEDWIEIAFARILARRPLEYCQVDLPFDRLKQFLLSAWIDDQISFYTRNSTWNSQRFELLAQVSDVLFSATLVLAALHALGVEHRLAFDLSPFLAGLTIVLPAIAAAVGAIRVKREYLRNAERYAHMVRPLSFIRNRIVQTQDPETLMQLLQEAHEVTFREQQDWRVVFRFRELETP